MASGKNFCRSLLRARFNFMDNASTLFRESVAEHKNFLPEPAFSASQPPSIYKHRCSRHKAGCIRSQKHCHLGNIHRLSGSF